jgi:hypothetical protein
MPEDLVLPVTYFAEPGPHNTDAVLRLALARAERGGITHTVVASDTGATARRALEVLGAVTGVVVVTNPAGMALPLTKLHEYLPRFRDHKQRLVEAGAKTVPASISPEVAAELERAGASVTRVDWRRFGALVGGGLAGLDRVGVGTRVALMASVWACHAGLVPPGVEALAIAGTGFGGGGADTAVVVRTAAAWRDWRVLETLARPRESPPSES